VSDREKFQNFNGDSMESLFIPTEEDFQRWVTKAVKEALGQTIQESAPKKESQEQFLNREELVSLLKISMATLLNWQKNGLPYHKVQNRVYFLWSEVFTYIQSHKAAEFKPVSKTPDKS
jgi:hypothetical protein